VGVEAGGGLEELHRHGGGLEELHRHSALAGYGVASNPLALRKATAYLWPAPAVPMAAAAPIANKLEL